MIPAIVARRIQLIGLDVDGVMTDGGVYIGKAGAEVVELKRFDILDNVGVKLLKDAGLTVVVVSGRVSPATEVRAEELGVDELVQDPGARKLPAFEGMLIRRGLRMEDAAFVGDDLPDLPVLRRVGLPIAVANAIPEVREVAQYVTTARGGAGAVREVAEVLLRARGEWDVVVADYLKERGDASARASRAF